MIWLAQKKIFFGFYRLDDFLSGGSITCFMVFVAFAKKLCQLAEQPFLEKIKYSAALLRSILLNLVSQFLGFVRVEIV